MKTKSSLIAVGSFFMLCGFSQCGVPSGDQGVICYATGNPADYTLPGIPLFAVTAKSFELCYDACTDKLLNYVYQAPGSFTVDCVCRDGSHSTIEAQNNSPDATGTNFQPIYTE